MASLQGVVQSPRLRWIVGRIGQTILVLLIISFIVFALFNLLPTNVALSACGKPCTPEAMEKVQQFYGLDKAFPLQFLDFLKGIFVGRTYGEGASAIVCDAPCFGYSQSLNEPVTQVIAQVFPVTLSIAIGAALLGLIFGVGAGLVSALRSGTILDRTAMATSVAGVSAPTYLVGFLLILIFGLMLGWFPAAGYAPLSYSPAEWVYHLILPWVAIAFLSSAIYSRLTRATVIDVMQQDYIRTARAKGLRESTVVGKHALRNVLLPVITVLGYDLGALLGGAVITETVFSMNGLGKTMINAVDNLDLPLLLGATLFAAFMIVLANLVVDLLYQFIDPRTTLS